MEKLFIKLGDIIKIYSEDALNGKIFMVKYLDGEEMVLINDHSLQEYTIPLKNGKIDNSTISNIELLNRSEHDGYTLQNNLINDTWINIHIGGDVPSIITGKITNNEFDMIEITTYPDNLVIYIDFEYKGLPKVPPILKIIKRASPLSAEAFVGDAILETEEYDEDTLDALKDIILKEDDIVFGKEVGEISQNVEVPESEKRYSIDIQANDLFDELISSHQKTNAHILNECHKAVERFKQLRKIFSSFDDFGTAERLKYKIDTNPLVDNIFNLREKYHWIIPVSRVKRKIYDIEDEDLYADLTMYNMFSELERDAQIYEHYQNNNVPEGKSKYDYIITNINNSFTPFEPSDRNDHINKQKTQCDINTILDGEEFISNVAQSNKHTASIVEQSFVQQKYITDPFRTKRDDSIALMGFLLLPIEAILYSHINHPTSSILKKIHLENVQFNLWQILKDVAPITNIIDSTSKIDFFKTIKMIIPSKSLDNYKQFLTHGLPTINTFIDYFSRTKKDISIYNFIKRLSPINIYHGDLVKSHFIKIKKAVENNIDNIKKNIKREKGIFEKFYKKQWDVKSSSSFGKYDIINKYAIDDGFSSEIIQKIFSSDGGHLFFSFVSMKNIELFNKQLIGEKISIDETNCSKYILAKQYVDEGELLEDDNNEIFFDKKYDPTNYDILNEIPSDKKNHKFVVNYLIENDYFSNDLAEREAEAMIEGRRKVRLGNFCFYLNENDQKKYYERKGNKWALNSTVNDGDFLCNSKANCFQFKEKCDDFKNVMEEIKKKQLAKALAYFDDKHKISKEELREKLTGEIILYSGELDKLIYMQKRRKNQYNNKKYRRGLKLLKNDNIIKESPYTKILNTILKNQNFVKKQNNIILFVNRYCRVNTEDESEFWFYCVKTDVPLLPTFLYKLAQSYETRTYIKTLDLLISQQGELSDDGGYIVDKHSGYIIKYINFDTTEGYDEGGFKVVSRELLEAKITETNPEKKYKTPQSQMIFNIIDTFCQLMGMKINNEENIISDVLSILKKEVPSKVKFDKVKKKKKISYDDFYNDALLIFTVCFLIVECQTSIPPIVTNTTFPGCKRSFAGWPLENKDDYSTIEYFACSMRQLSSDNPPWNVVRIYIGKNRRKKEKEQINKLKKKLILYIRKKILRLPFINRKIQKKIKYETKNRKIEHKPNDYGWHNFLPPLRSIHIQDLNETTANFERVLMVDVRTGNSDQYRKIQAIKGKIFHYSLSIQEYIQKILNTEIPILITNLQEPHVENVCCNEGINNTLDFFKKKNGSIEKNNKIVHHLEQLVALTHHHPGYIINTLDTKLTYPSIKYEFSEKTIYAAFIRICKFNTNIPLNKKLSAICENNQSRFQLTDSLENKINTLKGEGVIFNKTQLDTLLHAISHSLTVDIPSNPISYVSLFKNENMESDLYKSISEYIDSFASAGLQKKEDDLRNYLLLNIKKMKEKFKNYFKNFVKKPDQGKINHFFDNFVDWPIRGDGIAIKKVDETAFFIRTVVQKMIIDLTRIFPTIILNTIDFRSFNNSIPKHWKLSSIHVNHIKTVLNENSLREFFDDEILNAFLKNINERTKEIQELSYIIPFMADKAEERVPLNGVITKELYEYLLLRTFDSYIINIIDDDEEIQLKEKIAHLLLKFILMFEDKKKKISLNNEQIIENIHKTREKEKNIITLELKEMSIDERKIENIMKNHKLGKWSLGQTKAFHVYAPEQYEKEIQSMEKQALSEFQLNNMDDVTSMNREIYSDMLNYDDLVHQRVSEEINNDMRNIQGDDEFGDPDEEKIF